MNDNGFQVNHAAKIAIVSKVALLNGSDNVFRRADALLSCTLREIVAEQDALKTAMGRLDAMKMARRDAYALEQQAKAMSRGYAALAASALRMDDAVASGEYSKAAKRA
jgi:two-component sensor histidine kinase